MSVSESDIAKTREQLQASEARLEKIVKDSYNEIYLVNDKTLTFEYANNSALTNLGYAAAELMRMRVTDLFRYPDELALDALLKSLRKGATDRLRLQVKFRRKDASQYDADALIQILEEEKSFVIIVTDITDKLVTERKLLDTIHEKETLIKEIHHRVKNNLQLISSILYLKMVTLTQSDIRNFLEDTRQKIKSIALIHERLLQSEQIEKVEIADYLGKLIHDLKISSDRPGLKLEFSVNVRREMLGIDTAIMCGLIVNELVTNSIKHAFAGRASGHISVGMLPIEPEGKYQLEVSDDGVSLPGHVDPGQPGSFGMQLLDVFIKQLGGSCEIIRENGTKFRIVF